MTLGTVINSLKLCNRQNVVTKYFEPNWEKDNKIIFFKYILPFANPKRSGTEKIICNNVLIMYLDNDDPD